MLFPRMGFWQEEGKIAAYRAWLNPEYNVVDRANNEVKQTFNSSEQKQAQDYVNQLNKKSGSDEFMVQDHITWGDNIRFFFKYRWLYVFPLLYVEFCRKAG